MPTRNGGEPQTWALRTTLRLADADARLEYVLLGATARLHMADGTVHRRANPRRIELSPYGQWPGDFEWLFEPSDDGASMVGIEVAHLSWEDVQSLAANGGRFEFEGRVEVLAAEEWGSLPLTVGAERTGESSRLRVLSVRPAGGSGPFLTFFGETTQSYLDIPDGGRTSYTRYALVNRELGEGLVTPVVPRGFGHAMLFAGGSLALARVHELDVPRGLHREWPGASCGRDVDRRGRTDDHAHRVGGRVSRRGGARRRAYRVGRGGAALKRLPPPWR